MKDAELVFNLCTHTFENISLGMIGKNLILIRIQIWPNKKFKLIIRVTSLVKLEKNLYLEFVRHHIIFVSPYFHFNFRNPFTESNLYNYQIPPFIYSYHNAQLSGVPIEFTCDVLAVHWSTSEVDPLQDVVRLFITILEIDFSSFELNKIMKIKYIKYIIQTIAVLPCMQKKD